MIRMVPSKQKIRPSTVLRSITKLNMNLQILIPQMALSLQDTVSIQIAIGRDSTVDLLRLG